MSKQLTITHNIGNILLRWSGVALFLVLWEIAPRLEWVDPYFLPPFSTIAVEIFRLFSDGYLAIHILVSVWRAVVGLLVAIMIALPLGVLLGRVYTATADALSPILKVFSQVNPFSLLPVFVLFFGIGETAKICIVAWVSIWPILFYTITATRTIDPIQEKSAAALGTSARDMILKVIIPAALPTIFVGIRIGATITFYILVAAEMLGASAGLGYLVHNAAMNYQIPRIYAGSTFIVIFGYILNQSLLSLESLLFSWQEVTSTTVAAKTPEIAPRWRPGRVSAFASAAAFAILIIIGGFEVLNVNREASSVDPNSHSRHFGTPVDTGSGN
jgi:NitT/TauT family transport system permease protein